jgi:anti-anti-sigma factor
MASIGGMMTGMTDPHPDEPLTVSVGRQGDTARLTLAGELDLHTAERLARAVEQVLETAPEAIEVDAAGLTFADSAGLRALLIARDDAEQRGASLRLSALSEPLDRLLAITGLHGVLVAPTAG